MKNVSRLVVKNESGVVSKLRGGTGISPGILKEKLHADPRGQNRQSVVSWESTRGFFPRMKDD